MLDHARTVHTLVGLPRDNRLTKAIIGSKKFTIFLEDRDYSKTNLVDLKMSLDPLSTFRSTF